MTGPASPPAVKGQDILLPPMVGAPPPPPPKFLDELDLYALVEPEARRQGVPHDLVLDIIRRESSGDANAVGIIKKTGKPGGRGLMQLLPDTAKSYGVTDIFDPAENVRAGIAHFAKLLRQHKGNQREARAEYNGGADAVAALRAGKPWKETQQYLAGVPGGTVPIPPMGPLRDRVFAAQGAAPGGPPAPPPPSDGTEGVLPGQPFMPPVPASLDPEADEMARYAALQEGLAPAAMVPGTYGVERPIGIEEAPSFVGNPPPPPPSPVGLQPWYERAGLSVAQAYDPATPEGRRNLAGTAGAIGVGAATGGLGLIPAALLGTAGAAVAGGAEEFAEQQFGTRPPSGWPAIGEAAWEQGQNEAFGHLTAWPVRILSKWATTSTVGKYATEALAKAIKDAQLAGREQRMAASKVLRQTKRTGAKAVKTEAEAATQATEGQIAANRARAEQAVLTGEAKIAAAKQGAEAGVAQAGAPLVGVPPPSKVTVGERARAVVTGKAADVRTWFGKKIEAVAAKGPDLDLRAARAKADAILRPKAAMLGEYFSGRPVVEEGAEEAAEAAARAKMTGADALAALPSETEEALRVGAEEAAKERFKHPAMQIINEIRNAPDTVPFLAAHFWKTRLEEVIGQTRDSAVRKELQNVAMALQTQLRKDLSVYEPYNVATAKYAPIAKLFTTGLGPQLKKQMRTKPEQFVDLVNVKNPVEAGMLRQLLELGGDEGKAAFEKVQGAWMYENVLKGDPKGLSKRLAALTDDFRREFLNTPAGRTGLARLEQVAAAVDQAVTSGRLAVRGAQATAKAESRLAKREGAQALRDIKQKGRADVTAVEADALRATEAKEVALERVTERAINAVAAKRQSFEEFAASTLGRHGLTRTPEKVMGDAWRILFLPHGSVWTGISAARLLLSSTKSADLYRWAIHSPATLKAFTRVMNSRVPGMAFADLARTTGMLTQDRLPDGQLEVGNIDLYERPAVKNPAGGMSTVYSMSFEENGKEILVPRVSDDGRLLNDKQAIEQYHQTGKHLGIFDSPDTATTYAEQLHADYAKGRYGRQYRGVGEGPPGYGISIRGPAGFEMKAGTPPPGP